MADNSSGPGPRTSIKNQLVGNGRRARPRVKEGNWLAGGRGRVGPGDSKGNQLAGVEGQDQGLAVWVKDGPDCRLGLGTLPTQFCVMGL